METTQKLYLDLITNEVYDDPSTGLIEIDALICPAIQLLNAKGYVTSACCCGHEDDFLHMDCTRAYIQFDFGEITPEHLPEGWFWTDHGQQMEYIYRCQCPKFLYAEATEVMKKLSVWADSHPDTTA